MSFAKLDEKLFTGELAANIREHEDVELRPIMWAVCAYLIGCRARSKIGLYRMSIATIADDLGSPIDRVSIAVRSLIEWSFCEYDERRRIIFVRDAARHTWGESPSLETKNTKGLIAHMVELRPIVCKSSSYKAFVEMYAPMWSEILDAAGYTIDHRSITDRSPIEQMIDDRWKMEDERGGGGLGEGDSAPKTALPVSKPKVKAQKPKAKRSAEVAKAEAELEEYEGILTEVEAAAPGFAALWAKWLQDREVQLGTTSRPKRVALRKTLKQARKLPRWLAKDGTADDVLGMMGQAVERSWQGIEIRWWREYQARQGNNGARPRGAPPPREAFELPVVEVDHAARLRRMAERVPAAADEILDLIPDVDRDLEGVEARLQAIHRGLVDAAELSPKIERQLTAARQSLAERLAEAEVERGLERLRVQLVADALEIPRVLSVFDESLDLTDQELTELYDP